MNKLMIIFFLCLIVTAGSPGQSLQDPESWKLYDDSEVAVVEIIVDPADLAFMYENPSSDSLHEAVIHFRNAYVDEVIENVGFGIRGNTSRAAKKKSFKLSFNSFIPGRTFHGVDKINLNGEHNDPSIIRSKLCWDLYGKIGVRSTRAAHTAVYINGEYFGLYISVEHIDDEFLKKNYPDNSGNLWKCLYPADLVYLGSDPELYKLEFQGKRIYDLKTNENTDDYSQLARLIDIINNTPDENLPDSLESVLNIKETLQYFAVNSLTGSWDDYWFLKNNYYLYFEPERNIFHLIPYDYDNTYGIDWFGVDWTSVNPYNFGTIDGTQRPLIERLMANKQYRNLFTHFVDFYSNNVFDLPLWENRIDSLRQMITEFALADSFRTLDYGFTFSDFLNSYSAAGYTNQHVKRGLKEFINLRNNKIRTQLSMLSSEPIVYEINWQPKNPGPEDTIFVSASAFNHGGIESLEINFHPGNLTVVNTYPMAFSPDEGTMKVEEADKWTGKIPPLGDGGFGEFQILASDASGNWELFPRHKRIYIETYSFIAEGVGINEFLAKNNNTNTDESGEYDDWLELYNSSDQDVFLSGKFLSDQRDSLAKWMFPFGGVIIPAKGFLLIWCDNDIEQGPLHTNFKLSANGETIYFTDEDGATIIDSVEFGPQLADVSFGRFPDAAENWEFMLPSPQAPNIITSVDNENLNPVDFEIAVYPNPFNPETNIEFTLPSGAEVIVSIYNLLGEEIWRSEMGELSPGKYKTVWAADNVAAGIYLLRVQAGKIYKSHKIVYLK